MNKAFLLGAAAYPLLEISYRGRTHPAMALAGGAGMAALERINRRPGHLMKKSLLGAGAITLIEYGTGMLFNRRYQIWDYRGMRGNISGQVCPQFCMAWLGLAAGYAFLFRHDVI
ncbi:MAG: hypothetical protein E7324_01935 [Clostridiales bacterium]|nr:hypothetical protein [Clostridiales bacterium]